MPSHDVVCMSAHAPFKVRRIDYIISMQAVGIKLRCEQSVMSYSRHFQSIGPNPPIQLFPIYRNWDFSEDSP